MKFASAEAIGNRRAPLSLAGILIVLLLGTASSLGEALTPTTTTLSSPQNPSAYGEAVILTAVVNSNVGPPPGGEIVTFTNKKGTVLGTGALSGGTATLTISTLTIGTDKITAAYPGDSNFAPSTSAALSQLVSKATTTTTLTSSQNPSAAGQPVTFTASVAPEFSGTVIGVVGFYNGSTKLGNGSLSGGVASYTATKLPAGNDPISAVYGGSSSFTTSTSGVLNQAMNVGTFIDSTMTWDSITRYYEVYLPANPPANPPMVLMLHGTQTNSDDAEAVISLNWGWQPVADQYGFILVKPASTYDPNSRQWNWNSYFMDAAFPASESGTCTEPPATGCPDDAGFLRQLILNLTAQYNVNPTQVYVAGFSSGAQMAERVGVEISDLVAAIVPASGQLVGQRNPPNGIPGLPGNALAPIAVQEWHGTLDDELPPCNYGTTKYSGVTFTLDTVDDTFNYWVQQNSCSSFLTPQTLCLNGEPNSANDALIPDMPGLMGNIASDCTNNTQVQFIWEPDVAHNWQEQYDTARWLFFAANPMPATRSH